MTTKTIIISVACFIVTNCNSLPSGKSIQTNKMLMGGSKRGHVVEPIKRANINNFKENRNRFDFFERVQ